MHLEIRMRKKLTRDDVAIAAGVSPSTVSRALQGSDLLPIATIEHVRKVASKVGYHPNRLASAFAKKKSDTLAFVVPEIQGSRGPFQIGYYAMLLDAAVQEAESLGYTIRILALPYQNESIEKIKMLYASRCFDGLILNGLSIQNTILNPLLKLKIPLITVGYSKSKEKFPQINCRPFLALKQMLQTLEEKNYRELIYVKGDFQFHDAIQQESDLLEALKDSRIKLIQTFTGDYSRKSGYTAAKEIFKHPHTYKTAVFLANDLMASGFYRYCHEEKISLPETVGVIGSDDEIIARTMFPDLATIRQPRSIMGSESVKLLEKLLKNETKINNVTLDCEFISRESI